MPANVDTMAYVGETPWHGLGEKVKHGVHAEEMIVAAGLDWVVEKRPARGVKPIRDLPDGQKLYPHYEIVRVPRSGVQEEEVVFGIVTDKYEPLQNKDTFAFFDPIVDRNDAFFETAGALGQGERVWVMAKMPDEIEVVPGDICRKYLLLSNTHTGKGSVIVKFTAIRVVCQNTLLLALEDGQRAFRVRHSKVMAERLQQVADLIAEANKVYAAAADLFGKMARIRLNGELFTYLESVFPRTEKQKQKAEIPKRWTRIQALMTSQPDLQLAGVEGTLWAAYNAITRFEDYKLIDGETPSARLDRVWFGGGANVKLKALEKAQEFIGTEG